ncbi:MAG: glutamyl-tRNA amidotransferase [Candidatus Komeilibacteria bacterium CG10_big_fil_rev_8_21_14_0_10_41_13]|uniref:Glutamyl-tRNA amidotransferase n=1 Tax=Candidatus Komeilibacteria bacterium CG10_big_fil_rev_8_21_14_0_10_41_13 TaxID=1974476 RepID=A0A2M6WBR7_9BACT|nr:MAG: glutamyl-tRNA amidotransferase [Candidatus Komeilibacteria bacterium CG10_big_fil_rev_8_21_14_0_10_41_13]
MAELISRLEQDLVQALKEKNEVRLRTLRLLKSSLEKEKIAQKQALNDEEVIKVIKREAKKRQEAIMSYQQAGRDELAENEQAELKELQTYLPEEMSEQEIRAIAEKVLTSQNFSQSDFGQVMKLVMAEAGGKADGKKVSAIVKELL